jgi:hypothetical protein
MWSPHLSDPCCSWQTPSSHQLQHEQLWDQAQGNASHIQIEFKWFPSIGGKYLFATSTGEGHSYLVQECYVHFWESRLLTENNINICGLLFFSKGLFIVVTEGRDQSFSCIVIGGKVGAGPSSFYTVKSDQGLQWMKKWHRIPHVLKWIRFHGHP